MNGVRQPDPRGEVSEARIRGWLEVAVPIRGNAEDRAKRIALLSTILWQRYMPVPKGQKRPTLDTIGKTTSRTRERVRQQETEALKFLRQSRDRWVPVARGILAADHPLAKAIFGQTESGL